MKLCQIDGQRECIGGLELPVKVGTVIVAKGVVSKLVSKAQGHLSVLQHVVKGQVLNQVLGSVDLLVAVLKGRFDDESRRIASLGSRGVVGAGVAALGLDPRNVTVLFWSADIHFHHIKFSLTPSTTVFMKLVRPGWT